MPATSFPDYARQIEQVLNATVAAGEAALLSIQIDQRSSLRGFVIGLLHFNDASQLHFREFVDASQPEPRVLYAYHYQDPDPGLIFRYDNAAHRPLLPQAEHRHGPTGVESSPAPTLAEVLDEILGAGYLPSEPTVL